jgi:hypothetical protein
MIYAVRTTPIYKSEPLVRDPNYTRYVKQFPCVGCKRKWGIDPAHVGPHGTGQKASDLTVIPLCRACHRLFDSNPIAFAESKRLDIPALQRMFRRFYRLKYGTPVSWPGQPELTMIECACGIELFQEEFRITGCLECGRKEREAA